ncbi:hypothetical protein Aeqsu_0767 [Aequorivita sublithincola DSM 14238]|uniref:DUF1697 domain-containing protein n=1 Tax=Aequorivita sublithincola (strain DSM 14238 / LMG 21431 / ACAM 643 / 9-3) TaxID=746697 RepID=I3YTF6_AEQSU|nr:DUF1697 domain-containing protein [Aequorivita sublithincola]AFL80274.1 hypothetical protein Aeqsu_0767 [Aequorivita sublithincola DSM 14238]
MQTYIALLRGINVGGHKKIKMANLKLLFEELGLTNVSTYIQSGNVIFSAKAEMKLAEKISKAILLRFGFEIPVLVKTLPEIEAILAICPFSEEKKIASYFTFLNETPSKDLVEEVSGLVYPNEEFVITETCVYFFSEKRYHEAKCNNNCIEKKLKVVATTRNYRTLQKLLKLAYNL